VTATALAVHLHASHAQASAAQASAQDTVVQEESVKSRFLDDRKYRAVTLKNGLRVLLIEDSLASRSV
jgi:secreted Zn-dependent insulinase-like peptidase